MKDTSVPSKLSCSTVHCTLHALTSFWSRILILLKDSHDEVFNEMNNNHLKHFYIMFICSSSICCLVRNTRLSTSSGVSLDVSIGGRTAAKISIFDHVESYREWVQVITFDINFSSVEFLVSNTEDVWVVHYDDRNDWQLGLHCEMESTFPEG